MKKLSRGQHPVAITDPNVKLFLAKKHHISNIVPIKQIIKKKELVLAFRDDAENRGRIELLKKLLKDK